MQEQESSKVTWHRSSGRHRSPQGFFRASPPSDDSAPRQATPEFTQGAPNRDPKWTIELAHSRLAWRSVTGRRRESTVRTRIAKGRNFFARPSSIAPIGQDIKHGISRLGWRKQSRPSAGEFRTGKKPQAPYFKQMQFGNSAHISGHIGCRCNRSGHSLASMFEPFRRRDATS
jgi:hypothetical protein